MSLLRDTKGRRPPSNADAVRIYENMSKLPSFRSKYDWHCNMWTEEQIKLLHVKVRQVLQRIALDSVVKTYEKIDFDVKNSIANIIKSIGTDHLYHYMVEDSYYFLETIPPPAPFKFDRIPDVVFWSLVMDCIGPEKNFSKIPLDCQIKYLNSSSDGSLRILLNSKQIDKYNKLLDGQNNLNWMEFARKVGSTPYQCYLYYVQNPKSIDSGIWTEELDNRLIDAMSNNVGKYFWHEIAQKVGDDKTNEQCRLRWTRVLSKRDLNNISTNADKKLQDDLKLLVEIYGTTNWTLISRHLNLTDKQCRAKYFASITDNSANSDKMQLLVQAISDSDWQINKIKKILGLDITICRRRWARLDPLGYFIYHTSTFNLSNNIGEPSAITKLMNLVKELKYKNSLQKRILMLKNKKLAIKKFYKSIDWDLIIKGFRILYFLLGESVLRLESIVLKNFNKNSEPKQFDEDIKVLPANWPEIITEMLSHLWPIPHISVISITNKHN